MTKPAIPQEPRDITAPVFFLFGMLFSLGLYLAGLVVEGFLCVARGIA